MMLQEDGKRLKEMIRAKYIIIERSKKLKRFIQLSVVTL
jgi:hypothetical protein